MQSAFYSLLVVVLLTTTYSLETTYIMFSLMNFIYFCKTWVNVLMASVALSINMSFFKLFKQMASVVIFSWFLLHTNSV